MEISVEKIGGKYVVSFGFEHQHFILEYGGTKAEANWRAKMLKKCFANYKKSLN